MNLKEKIKSVGFWSGLVGTIFLLLGAFGVEIGDETVSAVVNAVCSLLVMFGVVSSPATGEEEGEENDETANDENSNDKTEN